MSTIPEQYRGAGYGTIYGDSEARQAIANAEVAALVGGGGGSTDPAAPNAVELSDGTDFYKALSEGTPATGVTGPTGGSGGLKWLSGIWDLANSIKALLPSALVSDRFKVDGSGVTQPTRIVNRANTYVTGTIASSGDNTIIAAPGASTYIYVTDLTIQNESAVATTIILKDSAAKMRVLGQNQGDGISKVYPVGGELKLAVNQPLILNLSGANSVGYSIGYYTGS